MCIPYLFILSNILFSFSLFLLSHSHSNTFVPLSTSTRRIFLFPPACRFSFHFPKESYFNSAQTNFTCFSQMQFTHTHTNTHTHSCLSCLVKYFHPRNRCHHHHHHHHYQQQVYTWPQIQTFTLSPSLPVTCVSRSPVYQGNISWSLCSLVSLCSFLSLPHLINFCTFFFSSLSKCQVKVVRKCNKRSTHVTTQSHLTSCNANWVNCTHVKCTASTNETREKKTRQVKQEIRRRKKNKKKETLHTLSHVYTHSLTYSTYIVDNENLRSFLAAASLSLSVLCALMLVYLVLPVPPLSSHYSDSSMQMSSSLDNQSTSNSHLYVALALFSLSFCLIDCTHVNCSLGKLIY